MPKASKVGKARAAAKASPISRDIRPIGGATSAAADVSNDGHGSKEALSRGQRKRLAKRELYLKREKMVMSSLRLKRMDEQKGKIDGLDLLKEALPSLDDIAAASKARKAKQNAMLSTNTNKAKKQLASAEISQFSLVLDHPSFKSNPFESIQQHLRNSLAPEVQELEAKSKRRGKEHEAMETKKKEERKERQREARFLKKAKGGRKGGGRAAKRV